MASSGGKLTKTNGRINKIIGNRKTTRKYCVVLEYKRVSLLIHDPLQRAVEPYLFESQMEYLAENYRVISTDTLYEHLKENREFEENCVVVTFDGGYSDIYYTAKEVIENYQIPTTVFLYSASITGQTEQFWWDELENLIIANKNRNPLDIHIDGEYLSFSLSNQHDRFYTYQQLYNILKEANRDEQKNIIEQIKSQIDYEADQADNHRFMDRDELFELSNNELFTIGSHGHDGVIPCLLEKQAAFEQIALSKQILEEATGNEIEYFSYPNHLHRHSDNCEYLDKMLKYAGFKAAFGSNYATVNCRDEQINLFDIPRIKVGNFHPYLFYQLLGRFFESESWLVDSE